MKASVTAKVLTMIVALAFAYGIGQAIEAVSQPTQPCEISGEQMVHLRDSFLMDEIEKGALNSFREPYVDSMLNEEATRRADSMYLRRLSVYD